MTPSRSQATRKPPRKSTNRRRFWLFAIALLIALAAGAAMFTSVLAGPKPMAKVPDTPAPEPTRTTGPAQPRATDDRPGPADDPSTSSGNDAKEDAGTRTGDARMGDTQTGGTQTWGAQTGDTQTGEQPARPRKTTTPPSSGDGGGSMPSSPASDYVYYKNCGQARKAGVAPLHEDDPGYSADLDRDGDGVACEAGQD